MEDVKAEKNCLPLLEFALTELWEQRDPQKRLLPLAVYRDMQRLTGALNKRAETVYWDDLKTDTERQWAERICLALVRIGPDVKDTRQRQPRQDLLTLGQEAEAINEVIEVLVQGRLLVTDRPSTSTPRSNLGAGHWVDLAHEALMTGWAQFAAWRQQGRDLRRLVQRVRDAAKEWQTKAEDERYLMQGGLLAEVREQWPAVCELAPATRHFYERSDAQEKEQVAFLERALAESELREQALKVMNLTSARPMEAAAMAIHSTGASHQTLQGRTIAPVQGRLRTIIDRVRDISAAKAMKTPSTRWP